MRKSKSIKREIATDSRYDNVLVAQFINHLMWDGKKSTARRVLYDCFDILAKQNKNPLEVFDLAIKNISPLLEVRSRRVGGANYQVPREVRGDRKITLAFRWILKVARGKKGKPMAEKLAEELNLAARNEGAAIKKKMDTYRMAEANRAFAHFSW